MLDLIEWMTTGGVDAREIYIHFSINSDFRIHVYQMVPLSRSAYTVGAEIPKKYLL